MASNLWRLLADFCETGDGTSMRFFLALALIWVLLFAAHYVRRKSKILSYLFLPGSVIAGIVALGAGPDVLGQLAPLILYWAKASFLRQSGKSGTVFPAF